MEDLSFSTDIALALKRGAVGILPTDTIYGLVASALEPKAVERVYELRRRDLDKPFIILIPSISSLTRFGVRPDKDQRSFLREAWPGSVSVILPAPLKSLNYLHRGKRSLAFRVPGSEPLRRFLRISGPLVAPSANIQGASPATSIRGAKKQFGDSVDFYLDIGRISRKASKLVDLTGGSPIVLRK